MSRPIRSHFFNPVWLYAAGAFLLVGMLIRQPAITLLAASVFVTAGVSWLWARKSLDGIHFSRHLSESRAFRGEVLTLTFRLENRSWLPLATIEIEEHVSDRIRPLDKDELPSERVAATAIKHATPLRWKQRVTWSVDLHCQERGAHFVGPTTIRAGDPFGFFTRQIMIEHRDDFLVYPEIVPITDLGLPPDHPFGVQRIPNQVLTDPVRVIGVRDYAPDDSLRYIHWKATARLGEPQTKVFEPTVDLQVGLFVSLDTFERYWEGMDSIRTESAIIAAASLASDALNRRATVGIQVNAMVAGSDQSLRIRPGRGPRQLERILEGLARLSPMAATNFPRLLTSEVRRLPLGSTVVVIACIMTEPLEAALRTVVEDGYRVMLVRVGDVAVPDLYGLRVASVPARLSTHGQSTRPRYARLINGSALQYG